MNRLFNADFETCCRLYGVPASLDFGETWPPAVLRYLQDELVENEYGLSLKSTGFVSKYDDFEFLNQSQDEDFHNHTHMDLIAGEALPEKQAFRLGLKLILSLAEKCRAAGLQNKRFWFYFQSADMHKKWVRKQGLQEPDDVSAWSDRLSFYTLRAGEEVLSFDPQAQNDEAMFWVDI